MEVFGPRCENAVAPLPPHEWELRDARGAGKGAFPYNLSMGKSRAKHLEEHCINEREKLQSQEMNSVKTLLRTKETLNHSHQKKHLVCCFDFQH